MWRSTEMTLFVAFAERTSQENFVKVNGIYALFNPRTYKIFLRLKVCKVFKVFLKPLCRILIQLLS